MNIDNLILLEPENVDNFYPFSILHPIWELRTGTFKIFEKAKKLLNCDNILFKGRLKHKNAFLQKYDIPKNIIAEGNILFLYSNIDFNHQFLNILNEKLSNCKVNSKLIFNDVTIGYYFTQNKEIENFDIDEETEISALFQNLDLNNLNLNNININNYLWDYIYNVGNTIKDDVKYLDNFNTFSNTNLNNSIGNVIAINPDNVFLGKDVVLSPSVVLDASEGPIIFDDNVQIMPQSTVIGPAFIGKNTRIKVGAKIYFNTAIGEHCKIGGEVEDSIIQAYSNKQHDGFLGHSFLSEWINLGADTNTSDLKNTYTNITVRLRNNEIKTNKMFLGLLCGDHTKSAINTQFNTGTVAGICGILVKEGFLPNYLPSFVWGGKKDSPIYKVDKAINVAKIVMARRNVELSDLEEKLIRDEYKLLSK